MDDLINRQDAINLLKKWADGYKYIETDTELAIKEFKYLSSAQSEPVRRGRWIDHQYKEFPIGRYECSVCGAKHDMPWDYCPNCGARMEEREWQS